MIEIVMGIVIVILVVALVLTARGGLHWMDRANASATSTKPAADDVPEEVRNHWAYQGGPDVVRIAQDLLHPVDPAEAWTSQVDFVAIQEAMDRGRLQLAA